MDVNKWAGYFYWSVDFIGESEVVPFFILTVSPRLRPVWRESY